MLVIDAICEVQRTTPSCDGLEAVGMDPAGECCSDSMCCAPPPTLVCETGCADTLCSDFRSASAADIQPAQPVLLPGAWAMGEGVLLDTGENDGRCVPPPCSAGRPDCLPGSLGLPRVAGSWTAGLTATMGTYLSSFAVAMTSCSRPPHALDGDFPGARGYGDSDPAGDPDGPPPPPVSCGGDGGPPLAPRQQPCCTRAPSIAQASKKDD